MFLRLTLAALAALVLLSTGFTVDCGRMCLMGGGGMHMDCWLARHAGIACDTGMLILLILVDMIAAASALYLWSLSSGRTRAG